MSDNTLTKKASTSYVIRTRKSTVKQSFISDHGAGIVVNYNDKPVDWLDSDIAQAGAIQEAPALEDLGKFVVEIGFGGGEVLLALALSRPQDFFIGIEVYPTGVARVLKQTKDNNIGNIALIQHDAVAALNDMFDDEVLDEIRVLFPDPWPKKRHHKRRLLNADVVNLMVDKLQTGGYLHIATDWQEYAEEIMQTLTTLYKVDEDPAASKAGDKAGVSSGEDPAASKAGDKAGVSSDEDRVTSKAEKSPRLENCFKGYAPGRQMGRPITKFEARALADGRDIYEFLFVKI
ncbi:MAG: tRNA (guanosine(46)-N7)-methyltransferase TrmB [Gammaproteobacteria bacterium]|nr:tRNA (guanosine(46)-N7)-methyltransferase TrmB [Gammaproteobacteria bacterium]